MHTLHTKRIERKNQKKSFFFFFFFFFFNRNRRRKGCIWSGLAPRRYLMNGSCAVCRKLPCICAANSRVEMNDLGSTTDHRAMEYHRFGLGNSGQCCCPNEPENGFKGEKYCCGKCATACCKLHQCCDCCCVNPKCRCCNCGVCCHVTCDNMLTCCECCGICCCVTLQSLEGLKGCSFM